MPALQNLQREADPDLRRRAFEAELAAWATVRVPLAAAMNVAVLPTITAALAG